MSRRPTLVVPVLACLLSASPLLLPAVQAQGVAPRAEEVLQALPAETLAVLLVDDVATLRKDFGESAGGRLWADPALAAVRDEVHGAIDAFAEGVLEQTSVDVLDLLDMVTGPAALALVHLGDTLVISESGDDAPPIVLALVLDLGERVDEFSAAIDQLAALADETPDTVLKTETVGDITVGVLTGETKDLAAVRYAFVGSYGVLTLQVTDGGRDDFATIVEGLAGSDQAGFASGAAFRASPAGSRAADVRLYVDVGRIARNAMALEQAGSSGAGSGPGEGVASEGSAALEEAEAMGVFALGPLSMTSDTGAQGSRSTFDLAFSGGGRIQDLLLAAVSHQAPRLEALVPADVLSCVSLDLDLAGVYDAGLKWLMEEDPEQARETLAAIEEGASSMGFHPREDLLGNLDGQVAYFAAGVDPAEALPFAEPEAEPSNFVFMLGLSDGEAVRSALDSVIRANGLHAARERHEFEGFEYYTLPVFPGVQLVYAALDDLLVVSLAPSLLTDVLRRKGASDLPSIGRRDDVLATLADLPSSRTAVTYSDEAGSMRQMQSALGALSQMAQGKSELEFLRELMAALVEIDPASLRHPLRRQADGDHGHARRRRAAHELGRPLRLATRPAVRAARGCRWRPSPAPAALLLQGRRARLAAARSGCLPFARRMTTDPLLPRLLLAALLPLAAGGCIAREVGPVAGREHLATVATVNYAFAGSERLERFVDAIAGAASVAPEHSLEASSSSPSAGLPVQLDLALLRELQGRDGRRVLVPVQDGDVLLDSRLRPGTGDGLKLAVKVDRSCYLYVLLVDASARPWQLFPHEDWSSVGNPLQGERPYRLPEGNILYPLGATRGIETLYVVVSATPLVELEALMLEFAAADWSGCGAPTPVQHAMVITRGVASQHLSVAPAVVAPSGALSDVPSRSYVGVQGERMVVTRWFRHQ